MPIDLVDAAKERNIRYFLISYTDLFGTQRAKLNRLKVQGFSNGTLVKKIRPGKKLLVIRWAEIHRRAGRRTAPQS